MLLLALAGVAVEDIAADYALSAERLAARCAARGEPDQGPLGGARSSPIAARRAPSSSRHWYATSTSRGCCGMRD